MLNKNNESSPPVIHVSDEDCEAAAAAAREEGTDMIRNHLGAHLALNPNSSYVSWIATLHPENAHITIDSRFMKPGNPWLTVYEESKATLHVTGVPIDNENENTHPQDVSADAQSEHPSTMVPRNFGGLVAFLVGFSFCVSGVLVAFALEVTSACVYLLAVAFQYLCNLCANPKVDLITFLPFAIFWILLQVFRFTDILLLIVNVNVVELLAAISWFLCGLLALDCDVGGTWHQQTRRLCHHTRWAFRVPFKGWNPRRVMIGCGGQQENDDEEERFLAVLSVTTTGEVFNNKNVRDATPVGTDGENVIVIHHDDIMVVDADEERKSSEQG